MVGHIYDENLSMTIKEGIAFKFINTHSRPPCLSLSNQNTLPLLMAVNSKKIQHTPKVKMVKCAFIPVISVSSKNGMYTIMGLGAHTPPMLIVVFDLLGSHNKSSKQLLSDFYYLVSFSLNPILIFKTTVSCFLNALLHSYFCSHKAWVSAFSMYWNAS